MNVLAHPLRHTEDLRLPLVLDPETPIPEISAEYLRRTRGESYPPKVIANAPCQEVILQGDDANILNLPAPMVHDGDGGRYIGTWQFVVAKDLDTFYQLGYVSPDGF